MSKEKKRRIENKNCKINLIDAFKLILTSPNIPRIKNKIKNKINNLLKS